jgi:hypothetical protein
MRPNPDRQPPLALNITLGFATVALLVACLDAAWHHDMAAAAWRWIGALICLAVAAAAGTIGGPRVVDLDEEDVDL